MKFNLKIIFIVALTAVLLTPQISSAYAVPQSKSLSIPFNWSNLNITINSTTPWEGYNLNGLSYQAAYGVGAATISGGVVGSTINDQGNVTCNQQVIFKTTKSAVWNQTGNVYGTPYAEWGTGTPIFPYANLLFSYIPSYTGAPSCPSQSRKFYVSSVVTPPQVSYSVSGLRNCTSGTDADGESYVICTTSGVESTNSITFTFTSANAAATFYQAYSDYYDGTSCCINLGGGSTCHTTPGATYLYQASVNHIDSMTYSMHVAVVNGACGTAANTSATTGSYVWHNGGQTDTFSAAQMCSSGDTPAGVNSVILGGNVGDQATWTCNGPCGTPSTCTITRTPTGPGVCDPTSTIQYGDTASSFAGNLCTTGISVQSNSSQTAWTPTFPTSGHSVSWWCYKVGGSWSAQCTASKAGPGACGPASTATYNSCSSNYSGDYCSSGIPVTSTSSTTLGYPTFPAHWWCYGTNGVYSPECHITIPPPTNGACNTAVGSYPYPGVAYALHATFPTSGFCSSGVVRLKSTYYYRVRATNAGGQTSAPSDAVGVTTPP